MTSFLRRNLIKPQTAIIAHRGYWRNSNERNSKLAFEKAFDNNFGIETDLRDYSGEIIISHDIPTGNEISFEEVLKLLDGRNLTLALNIKADGLANKIKKLLDKYKHTNYFTFDMSIPEMVIQNQTGLNFFTGLNDIITTPVMLKEASGIWLDSFYSDWFGKEEIKKFLKEDKEVCIVSPELHNREYPHIWRKYKNINGIMLCTDYPLEAMEYFNE